ncbi:MAG TPA: LutB/LldF family L-lactate oxidation iron-sulfur protein [Terriglobales bacterium]|jgi:L-lactate dehydrogenase complex protein LldF|nr:LutB/LldF family L-lactate oxidation iron-sulfur protein [Terriglobales bacterium]
MTVRIGWSATAPDFQDAAKVSLGNAQLRRNVKYATDVIRAKRAKVVGEMPDWEQLRQAGGDIKAHTMRHLDRYLLQFEENMTRAGGQVHWARDADEANQIVRGLIGQYGGKEVIKVKTMTSDEVQLNRDLEAHGITPYETDLADMILQLSQDKPSHIVVPALHKNRFEVREIFKEKMHLPELGDQPTDLTDAARHYLRQKFLTVKIGFSGANFAVAETGSLVVVESEGNGRMCLTLPDVLISLVGIEKIVPTFQDLEVFLQTLPRSATGERMNPYTSIWTGVTPGDGPQAVHVVLLDNGRTAVHADPIGRQTLHCIRCAACLNACPVYRQTGGHAYGSVYQGPIGAILTPQLQSMEHSQSLPYASSLCGACYEVCPVKIDIPEVLIHLRGKVVREKRRHLGGKLDLENLGMQAMTYIFADARRLEAAQRMARIGQWPFVHKDMITKLPGMLAGWTAARDLRPIPKQSFREWWRKRERKPNA